MEVSKPHSLFGINSKLNSGKNHSVPSVPLWTDRCFSLKDGVWTQQPSMLIKREYGVAATTDKGFLVSGGYTSGSYQRTDSTEYFISGTWVKGPTMPVAMTGHCLIPVGTSAIIAGSFSKFQYQI